MVPGRKVLLSKIRFRSSSSSYLSIFWNFKTVPLINLKSEQNKLNLGFIIGYNFYHIRVKKKHKNNCNNDLKTPRLRSHALTINLKSGSITTWSCFHGNVPKTWDNRLTKVSLRALSVQKFILFIKQLKKHREVNRLTLRQYLYC